MGDLAERPGPMVTPETAGKPKPYYPHLSVPAKAAGLEGARIGQQVNAQISGTVTSMHAGEGSPASVGLEVKRMRVGRKLKEESLRRKLRTS